MSDPIILPVRPGSLSAKDKAALRRAGVIVIEHEQPDELRLLRPRSEVDAGQMLNCALQALVKKGGYRSDGSDQREAFTQLLAAVVKAATKEPQVTE